MDDRIAAKWLDDAEEALMEHDSLMNRLNTVTAERDALREVADEFGEVYALYQKHCETWMVEDEWRWMAGLQEEVLELSLALRGRHEHQPELELMQIAAIALNWLRHFYTHEQRQAALRMGESDGRKAERVDQR